MRSVQLSTNPDLVRLVAVAPYDEARWTELEAWLIDRGDPRGELVMLEQADEAAAARERMAPLLFGVHHALLARRKLTAQWRGGFMTSIEISFASHRRSRDDWFAALLAAPAALLVRELDLWAEDPALLARMLRVLAMAPCGRALRRLTLRCRGLVVDGGALAPLAWLEELVLVGPTVMRVASMPALQRLAITPMLEADLRRLLAHERAPALRALSIDAGEMAAADADAPRAETWTELLAGSTAPALERLELVRASAAAIETLVDRVRAGQLPLRELSCGDVPVVAAELGLPRLALLELPAGIAFADDARLVAWLRSRTRRE